MLKVLLKKEKQKTVTVANPKSDLQWVADSKSYGMKFIRTGSDHLCIDLNFKAAELTTHCGERAVMKKDRLLARMQKRLRRKHWLFLNRKAPTRTKN